MGRSERDKVKVVDAITGAYVCVDVVTPAQKNVERAMVTGPSSRETKLENFMGGNRELDRDRSSWTDRKGTK